MKYYIIKNLANKQIIADKVILANSFLSRMVGLLGRKELKGGEGLIITSCRSIHMVFMRFAIDVIFVNDKCEVVGLVKNIKPYQFSPVFFKANRAIELPSGTIDKYNVQSKNILEIRIT